MQAALALARRGWGRVWPNPAVGCIIARDGVVVGRGWTQPGGRPHAETEALRRAGEKARGATAYVTLEPCAHHGATPPCAEALIAAGIRRCVVAIEDPDSRVAGKGTAMLREAGIVVEVGQCAESARETNAGYLSRCQSGRPLVVLKTATTLDGRIATHNGYSRWITGEAARHRTHMLRGEHDAIMIGAATAMADDPELTCRIPGMEDRSPVRIVVDSRMQLPLTARLVKTAATVPTWLLTLGGGDRDRARAYEDAGVTVVSFSPDEAGALPLDRAMTALGERGITRLLVEGGGRLAAALLHRRLIDRLLWFRAPSIVGGDGIPGFAALGLEDLAGAPRFEPVSRETIGVDTLETYRAVA